MIITVEKPVAQHLHVNPRLVDALCLTAPEAWSVRVTGDFMIIMNNLMALPVIVRHPQRFTDSRSFITAFKQGFLQMMELIAVPHAKIRMVRDAQFQDICFTNQVADAAPRYLQSYQDALTGSKVDWDQHPTSAELSLQLAKQFVIPNPDTDGGVTAVKLFENYVLESFALPAHPSLNEHNRNYLYHSGSLNDVLNAVAVDERLLKDYRQYLENRDKSDQAIDCDLDTADDYFSFCDGYEETIFDDLTLVYNYLIQYEKSKGTQLTTAQFEEKGVALRELGRFMRYQRLFSTSDFDHFVQAIGQGIKDLRTAEHNYYFHRLLRNVQDQVESQRGSLAARQYNNKRYQLLVTLDGYRPTMWRRFSLSGDTRLDMLCYQLLASFRANGSHLFVLHDQRDSYQLPAFDSGISSRRSLLEHWLGEYQAGSELTLIYDLGDIWKLNIKIEKVTGQSRFRSGSAAKLLAGGGRGIVEDIGGAGGLMEVAKDIPDLNNSLNVDQEQKAWRERVDRLRQSYR